MLLYANLFLKKASRPLNLSRRSSTPRGITIRGLQSRHVALGPHVRPRNLTADGKRSQTSQTHGFSPVPLNCPESTSHHKAAGQSQRASKGGRPLWHAPFFLQLAMFPTPRNVHEPPGSAASCRRTSPLSHLHFALLTLPQTSNHRSNTLPISIAKRPARASKSGLRDIPYCTTAGTRNLPLPLPHRACHPFLIRIIPHPITPLATLY